jgi:peroxiredoxin/YHS domain-containing protein
MNTTLRSVLLTAMLMILAIPAWAAEIPDRAVCQVCAVNGERQGPERVAAASMIDGVTYCFCSKKCQEAFNADPSAYILPPFPWPAPRASVRRLDGVELPLDGPRQKLTLVNFWRATGCAPCEEAMPEFEQLLRERGYGGLSVLGISIDNDRNAVEAYLHAHQLTYPVAMDLGDEPAWAAFHVKTVPTSFLIDRQGQVVGRWAGKNDPAVVLAAVDSVLATTARY